MKTVRAMLIIDLAVGICCLAIGAAVAIPARTNQQAMVGAATLAAAHDLSNMVAAERGALPDGKIRLSKAEFAAAMRAGHGDAGVWDAGSKTFIIEAAGPRAARPRAGPWIAEGDDG